MPAMPSRDAQFESRVIRIMAALLVFVPIGYSGRFLIYFLWGADSFVSNLLATLGTLLSIIIFLPLSYYLTLSKTLIAGFLTSAVSLLFLQLWLWAPRTLTIKSSGQYLFLEGYITGAGIVSFLPLALLESAISCAAFLAYRYLLLRYAKMNPDGSDIDCRRDHRAA
jgi:hypothetical protein